MRKIAAYQSILCILLLVCACSERTRDNPFDPNSESPPIVTVSVTANNNSVLLNWDLSRSISDLQGFRIYRSDNPDSGFAILADVDADTDTYLDNSVINRRWYYYQISVLGVNVESVPSESRGALPGPGTHWILDSDNSLIQHAGYDLLGIFSTHTICSLPMDWVITAGDSLVWMAYAFFGRGVCKFNRETNAVTRFDLAELAFPVDIEYDSDTDRLYLLDQDLSQVLTFYDGEITDTVALDPEIEFQRMSFDEGRGRIVVVGGDGLYTINDTEVNLVVTFEPGMLGQDLLQVGNILYFVAASESDNRSVVYTMDAETGALDSFEHDAHIYRLGFDWHNDYFYVAEAVSGADDKVVQLSASGQRLVELAEAFSFIEQLAINPFDRSLVVVDAIGNAIYMFDEFGEQISSTENDFSSIGLAYPVRVHIE